MTGVPAGAASPKLGPGRAGCSQIMITERSRKAPRSVEIGDVARLAEALAGVRLTASGGLAEWRTAAGW